MRLLIAILALCVVIGATAQTSSPQDQSLEDKSRDQQPSTSPAPSGSQSETNAKHLAGERTVVGCVVQSGDTYVLKTADQTFPINSDRDVTPYIGKKVRIEGHWEATGITTMAPVQGSSSSKPEKASASSGRQSGPAFGGELRLRIIGTVIGDCSETEK